MKATCGICAVALTIAVCFVLIGCGKPEQKETAAAPSVQVTAVTQATIRRIVQGDGALFPRDQASITPKISAPVQKFYVNRGDRVQRGQLLAVLENRDLISAAAESKGALVQAESSLRTVEAATVPEGLGKAQADVSAAREARDSARKVFESRQQLFRQGALAGRLVDESQVAFTQAESQLRVAQDHLKATEAARQDQIRGAAAQVESAKAHLDTQDAQVAYTRVTSPISGVVADRPLNAGEMANAGTPLIAIVDISKLVARVNVPQAEAPAVRTGQAAVLTQPDATGEIEGRVTVVSPAADPNTTTVQVWIEVENSAGRLRAGSAVHAAIATEVFKAAAVVPAAAILPGEEGGTAVLTVSSDSVAHKRKVALGVREGNQVQVISGVNPGEEVVIVGGVGLDDNTKVKIVTTAVEEPEDDNEPPAPDEQPKPAPKPAAANNKNK